MHLSKFRVQNYRSIVDSGWVTVDDLAVIVGKNESGKTSLLKALWKFNPFEPHPYSLDREWPRGRRKERSPEQVVVVAVFDFDDRERAALAQIHASAANITGVQISKKYGGGFIYEFLPKNPDREHGLEWVVSVIERHLRAHATVGSPHFNQLYVKELDATVQVARAKGGSAHAVKTGLPALKGKLASFVSPDGNLQPTDNALVAVISSSVDKAIEELSIAPPVRRAIDTAHEWLPTFIYMDDYRTFAGEAQLNQVLERKNQKKQTAEDETVIMLMKQAGLDLAAEVEKGKSEEREQRMLDMNDASQTLTREIATRWSQKRYEVQFQVDGQHFITWVKDDESKLLVPLEERSKGFQWFFSFDMWFMYETQGTFKNAILLLDEPGLHLHAAAQRDLLKRLYQYSKTNQTIYTTHLPFMVDFRRFDNIWVCEEKPGNGSHVHQDWGNADKDARFTLQAALGLSWSQSLFVGAKNLVVEGVSDFWYLQAMATLFEAGGEASISESIVITPAGGATKVAYVATLLSGQELDVAVLLDSDPEGVSAKEQLVHTWILKSRGVLMLGDLLGVTHPACIEDLFDEAYYLRFVQAAYARDLGGHVLTLDPQTKGRQHIVQRTSDALQKAGIASFNKGRVAKLLLADLSNQTLTTLSSTTVAAFKRVFDSVRAAFAAPAARSVA